MEVTVSWEHKQENRDFQYCPVTGKALSAWGPQGEMPYSNSEIRAVTLKLRSEGSVAVACQGRQRSLLPGEHSMCEVSSVRERTQSLRSCKNR